MPLQFRQPFQLPFPESKEGALNKSIGQFALNLPNLINQIVDRRSLNKLRETQGQIAQRQEQRQGGTGQPPPREPARPIFGQVQGQTGAAGSTLAPGGLGLGAQPRQIGSVPGALIPETPEQQLTRVGTDRGKILLKDRGNKPSLFVKRNADGVSIRLKPTAGHVPLTTSEANSLASMMNVNMREQVPAQRTAHTLLKPFAKRLFQNRGKLKESDFSLFDSLVDLSSGQGISATATRADGILERAKAFLGADPTVNVGFGPGRSASGKSQQIAPKSRRERAIDFLRANGKAVTEKNIKNLMAQDKIKF